MKQVLLEDGTQIYRYLEESGDGRVVVTLVPVDIDLYWAHREWHSDLAQADAVFHVSDPKELAEKVDWIRRKQKNRGEVLPDGSTRT